MSMSTCQEIPAEKHSLKIAYRVLHIVSTMGTAHTVVFVWR